MGKVVAFVFFLSVLLLLPDAFHCYPLCTDSRSPLSLNTTKLSFCPYTGNNCCNSTQDLSLQKQYEAMKIGSPACASLIKSIMCGKCDPFSAELFTLSPSLRSVPLLCNSTVSAGSSQSNQAAKDFCSEVWETCGNVSMLSSPFSPNGPPNSSSSKLADLWQSKAAFCNSYGGASSSESVCFAGEPVALNSTATVYTTPSGLCLEKIGNGSYLNMVPHPDGSNRAFFSNQDGKIWLGTIPDQESKESLKIDDASPFLDLTDQVHRSAEFGMMGLAIHPNFVQNGRLFVSFNCDKTQWPGCSGRCACNSDVNCDPSELPSEGGAKPCQYHSVIAEYSTNKSATEVSPDSSAKPVEVRRIFTMGLPFSSHHAGQILFGPRDGYLYFMMGDGGGSTGDPYNFAQNKKSVLGKVMRLDVDNIPSSKEIISRNLWGNYSIPPDNPYTKDGALLPEIWSSGLRNPWRCSFDSQRPSYFMCADVGQDAYEEVNLMTGGGNYGWRVYENRNLFNTTSSPGGNTSPQSINPIFPVMGYSHSAIDQYEKSAAITGGYFYRSQTDPCTYGSYLYADLYAGSMWAGGETPENSGNFSSSKVAFGCAANSPMPCQFTGNSSVPVLGFIFSFGEDNNKDIYILASSGVYRIVQPQRCKFACSKASATPVPAPSSPATKLCATSFAFFIIFVCSLYL